MTTNLYSPETKSYEECGGDTDGDGIMDAEEIMPLKVSLDDLRSAYPPRYTRKYSGTIYADTYDMVWSNWGTNGEGKDYHDIDMNVEDERLTEEEKQAAEKFNERYVYNGKFLCLDPTDPDTDGDGVPDGVEIMDDEYEWPDQYSEGLYDIDEATNPLDPTDFNPNEKGTEYSSSG